MLRYLSAALLMTVAPVLLLSVALSQSGCSTTKEIRETIQQDPEHAPENRAYFAHRFLEAIVVELSAVVQDQSTPREVADAIKGALPAAGVVADALKEARARYILLKADLEAVEAQGLPQDTQRLAQLQAYLQSMIDAMNAADRERSSLETRFERRVVIVPSRESTVAHGASRAAA